MNSKFSYLLGASKIIAISTVVLFVNPLIADEFDYNVERQWQEFYSFSSEELDGNKLVVDNIIGSIYVDGYDGADLDITVDANLRGVQEDDLLQAEQELEMIVEKTGYGVLVFLETPFRESSHRYQNRSRDYRFSYDIKIRVPREFVLELKTVTGGDLNLRNTEGVLQLETVTGDIVVQEFISSGTAETVTGNIRLSYNDEPDMLVELDSRYGELFTEFNYERLSVSPQIIVEQVGQLTSYRRSPYSQIQFGRGGPNLRLKTLTGDITIDSVSN